MSPLCSKPKLRGFCLLTALFAATAAFSQSANDIVGATTQVNYAPVADPQHVTLNASQAIVITLSAYDADGDTLTFGLVSQPSQGTLTQFDTTTGKVTYTPPPNCLVLTASLFLSATASPVADQQS